MKYLLHHRSLHVSRSQKGIAGQIVSARYFCILWRIATIDMFRADEYSIFMLSIGTGEKYREGNRHQK